MRNEKTCKGCPKLRHEYGTLFTCGWVGVQVNLETRHPRCPKNVMADPEAVADLKELARLFRKLELEFEEDQDGYRRGSTKHGYLGYEFRGTLDAETIETFLRVFANEDV